MSQPFQSDNALSFANSLIALAAQLQGLIQSATQLQAAQASHDYAANLQAMPTYALTEAGTQGAADGTPVAGNPITGLNVSFYNLDVFRTSVLNDLVTFLTGSGTVTQSDRRTAIDILLP